MQDVPWFNAALPIPGDVQQVTKLRECHKAVLFRGVVIALAIPRPAVQVPG